jgi:hypothetical protein
LYTVRRETPSNCAACSIDTLRPTRGSMCSKSDSCLTGSIS